MPKKIQLSISEPCHENWDAMTTLEKGKFCSSCQKQVIDFSNMSDWQVAEFFKKPATGSLCGRFMKDQLERPINIPRKRIPWIKYFFQFAIPAFLLSLKVSSVKAQDKVIVNTANKKTVNSSSENEKILRGTAAIFPPDQTLTGDTIIMKEVILEKNIPQNLLKAPTGINRSINQFNIPDSPIYTIDTSIVLIAGGISVEWNPEKENQKVLIIKEPIVENAAPSFKVYPNPISSGINFTLDFKHIEVGYYLLEILNLNGQSVHQREILINGKATTLNFDLPILLAGNYLIVLTNKKSGKKFTEKLVIQ